MSLSIISNRVDLSIWISDLFPIWKQNSKPCADISSRIYRVIFHSDQKCWKKFCKNSLILLNDFFLGWFENFNERKVWISSCFNVVVIWISLNQGIIQNHCKKPTWIIVASIKESMITSRLGSKALLGNDPRATENPYFLINDYIQIRK